MGECLAAWVEAFPYQQTRAYLFTYQRIFLVDQVLPSRLIVVHGAHVHFPASLFS